MSDLKKFAMTWVVSTLVGFYSVFVLMQVWNWFAIPLLHVQEPSYWLIYGLNMLFGLMTAVGEQVPSETEGIWSDVGLMIFGRVVSRSLTLGIGFLVHLLV
ncbi:MAG: hypothetical protein DMG52_35500 [Acidobacteria bacterium]|nr:MAG: hypothetical protein DMG52_35500 [Acidobacteriota bacterium]